MGRVNGAWSLLTGLLELRLVMCRGKQQILERRVSFGRPCANGNNTLVHELGHTLGLRHIDQKAETFWENLFGSNPQYMTPTQQSQNANNAMFSGGSPYMNDKTSTKFTGAQIETARKGAAAGEINKTP